MVEKWMSLIPCRRGCTHQREGYCSLNRITELTGAVKKDGCPYYIALKNSPEDSQHLEGFVQASHPDDF